jgi:hypothetical protein
MVEPKKPVYNIYWLETCWEKQEALRAEYHTRTQLYDWCMGVFSDRGEPVIDMSEREQTIGQIDIKGKCVCKQAYCMHA